MLPDVFAPRTDSFDSVKDLGVVLQIVSPTQRHVGFLIRIEGEAVRVCHLGGHQWLTERPIDQPFGWLQSALDEDDRRNVVFFVDGIMRANVPQGIPYSPFYSSSYFDHQTHRYVRNAAGEGLTCATFVMAIYATLELPLLQNGTWERREDDDEWQRHIIDEIERNGRNLPGVQAHVEALRAHPESVRYRPEEVAAGVASNDAPLAFQLAATRGASLVQELTPSGASGSSPGQAGA